jgi:uncharacterized protein
MSSSLHWLDLPSFSDGCFFRFADQSAFGQFVDNVRHNLFKSLLMFFYMGFLVPILKIKFDFPQSVYQGLVIFLLVSIGWEGGERLALLAPSEMASAVGFMFVGFCTNFVIGVVAYQILKSATKLRRIDAATVAGYYGSDSAGTFATCKGVLIASNIAFASYMPVMLAVMEIPGCLVALYLVSALRSKGMDARGYMPFEEGYDPKARPVASLLADAHGDEVEEIGQKQTVDEFGVVEPKQPKGILSPELLHEVFLNPGLFLLFGGILIGFVSQKQGPEVVKDPNKVFDELFQGMLCLFLLEMGMTASRHLKDLKTAGWQFVAFGILAPNVFATFGMCVAHLYSHLTHSYFELGTYVMFAVLCGAASYIAVPAVQRLAIPEASPTLPLAASLGLTFSYNVTIGIPVYIEISKALMKSFPV